MKFTLSWLKEHLETDADLDEISEKLTMLGLEVEKIVDRSKGLESFVVGKVIAATQHPNADRLKLCTVDDGVNTFEVICGAPNAREGILGVFAKVGSHIPGTGVDLKATKIRGVLSSGMLLSERELGISDEHTGIIELPPNSPKGEKAVKILGLDDPIIEIAITPNRGDCLGVRGIARDLAASGMGSLKALKYKAVPNSLTSPISISLNFGPETNDACPYFVGRYIKGVKNLESPSWLKAKLISIGLRPISALVDITNFLTMDLGRPLHVFDANHINGNLQARLAQNGEKVIALNGKEYELDETMCVIADDTEVRAIGGLMGGESSGCTKHTSDVIVECAYFNPVRTAKTGRKLQILSDARFRFERGIDPAFLIDGAEIATNLIIDLCGGKASELIIAGEEPPWKRSIKLDPRKIRSLGGIDISVATAKEILSLLGFTAEGTDTLLTVSIPSWRSDIVGEACLVEEIVRVYGYDNIPPVSLVPDKILPEVAIDQNQSRQSHARRTLAKRGLVESVTYSFLSEEDSSLFGGTAPSLKLVNPISTELNVMRPSILPNLINAAKKNSSHALEGVALFELGPQFFGDKPDEEIVVAAGIRSETFGERHWLERQRPVDFFDAKADVLGLLSAIWGKTEQLQISSDAPDWFHPGKSAVFKLGPKNILAHFGEINPIVLSKMDVRGPIAAFEVFLENIPLPKKLEAHTRPSLDIPAFHKIDRDFAFVVDQNTKAEKVSLAAKEAEKNLVTHVRIFDVFSGTALAKGKKSIGINVTIQPRNNSLTESEIETIANRIIKNVNHRTGGILRD